MKQTPVQWLIEQTEKKPMVINHKDRLITIQFTFEEAMNLKKQALKMEEEERNDAEYWKTRCKLSEVCMEVSPCDPDITPEQISAHKEYHQFIKDNGTKG